MTNTNKQDQLRKLVWGLSQQGPNLEWIIERADHFTLGELQRDEKGYFISVGDVYLDKKANVYLGEEQLRNGNFDEDMREANETYARRQEEKFEVISVQRSSLRKNILRGAIIGLTIGASLVGLAGINYSSFNDKMIAQINEQEANITQMQQRHRAKKLKEENEKVRQERIAQNFAIAIPNNAFILENYDLANGENAFVHLAHIDGENRLCINVDRREVYVSRGWSEGKNPNRESLFSLKTFEGKTEYGWAQFEKEKLPADKVKKYDALLERIIETKMNGERK